MFFMAARRWTLDTEEGKKALEDKRAEVARILDKKVTRELLLKSVQKSVTPEAGSDPKEPELAEPAKPGEPAKGGRTR